MLVKGGTGDNPANWRSRSATVCFTCVRNIFFEHKINFCVEVERMVCFSCVWLCFIYVSFEFTLGSCVFTLSIRCYQAHGELKIVSNQHIVMTINPEHTLAPIRREGTKMWKCEKKNAFFWDHCAAEWSQSCGHSWKHKWLAIRVYRRLCCNYCYWNISQKFKIRYLFFRLILQKFTRVCPMHGEWKVRSQLQSCGNTGCGWPWIRLQMPITMRGADKWRCWSTLLISVINWINISSQVNISS